MRDFKTLDEIVTPTPDIRLCGDCANAIENPLWDSQGINRSLLCIALSELNPIAVTFSQSVNFCRHYHVEDSDGE